MSGLSQQKIEAIYGLREAVESKVRAEVALEQQPSPDARDQLLDATLDVEAKTEHAIRVCHDCGHEHAADAAHGAVDAHDNVIDVDFRRGSQGDADAID